MTVRATARVGLATRVSLARAELRHGAADAMRRAWYDEARADLAAGKLALGDTLLRASAIDAYADGAPFDLRVARQAYADRLAALVDARASGASSREAVSKTFADLVYTGIPGGRMGDLLLAGRGACEPIAQLLVATLYDAGVEGAGFRFYGGKVGGITHLAPTLVEGAVVHDLATGDVAAPGGASFPATGILEAYARAHALVENDAASPDDEHDVFGPKRATQTLASGYPANATRFEGGFPLYAAQAVKAPRTPAPAGRAPKDRRRPDDALPRDDFPHCATVLRIGTLDPQTTPVETRAGWVEASFERTPRPEALERIASIALELESFREDADLSRRVGALACLAGTYQRAARDLALAGKDDVAARAAREARRAASEGADVLRRVDAAGERALLADLARHAPGEAWVLLFLPGGDALALRDLAPSSSTSSAPAVESSRILLVAALIVAPETRADAIRVAGTLEPADQVEVMHEMFGSQDAARPWASIYALGAPPGLETDPFVRAYDVFRGMAWSLWDADRPIDETLADLGRDLDDARVALPLRDALVGYLVRNAVAHAIIRKRGRAILTSLARFVEHDPGGAGSRTIVDAMRASATFDLGALADATRAESRARARSDGPVGAR